MKKLTRNQLRNLILREVRMLNEYTELSELPSATTYNAVSRHIKPGFDQIERTLDDYVGKLRDRGVRLNHDELSRTIKIFADNLIISVAHEQFAPSQRPTVDEWPISQEPPPGGTWLGSPPSDPAWDEPPE